MNEDNIIFEIFEQDLKFNFYSKGGSGGIFFHFIEKCYSRVKHFYGKSWPMTQGRFDRLATIGLSGQSWAGYNLLEEEWKQ